MPWTCDSPTAGLVLLPLLIFCACILDVSVGTLRILFVARSYKGLAALLGFVESEGAEILLPPRT